VLLHTAIDHLHPSNTQVFLLLVAFFCVPVLLLGKPYMLKRNAARTHRNDSFSSENGLVEDAHISDGVAVGTLM
jgi:hypothetical protein